MSEDEDFEFRRRAEQEQQMSAMMQQAQQSPPAPSLGSQVPEIVKQAGQAVLDYSPAKLTQKFMQTDPATMQRVGGPALPVVGGLLGGPGGAIAGEALRQFTGTAFAPETVPQTSLGRAASMLSAGVAQEPKILNVIPGVPQATKLIGNLATKAGANAAKFAEAVTGAKGKDLMQAAKQGYSTYLAPSMEKAQEIFGNAARGAGVPAKPPLNQILDPQLSTARDVALEVGSKLQKGAEITAAEALNARQAVDRIYNATPIVDRAARAHLADLRTAFDTAMSDKSGALKQASMIYRQAIVKSNLLNPFRITKQGQMSAVAPMIATLAASVGGATGHKGEAGLGGLGYLAASSPLIAGLGFTSAGQAMKGLNSIAQNPIARQALLQVFQRLTQKKSQGQP